MRPDLKGSAQWSPLFTGHAFCTGLPMVTVDESEVMHIAGDDPSQWDARGLRDHPLC